MRGHRIAVVLLCALAACTSDRAASAGDDSGAELAGTAWQLMEIRSTVSGATQVNEPSKYTLSFAKGGQLAAHIDCNNGTATWKATPGGGIEFGPLATTRALCPPDSLHNRVVRDLPMAQSYEMANGHLQLKFKKSGDVYVFEPLPKS